MRRRLRAVAVGALVCLLLVAWALVESSVVVGVVPDGGDDAGVDGRSWTQQEQQRVGGDNVGPDDSSSHQPIDGVVDGGHHNSNDGSHMHFITVQTGPSPPWCRMLLSAYLSNVTVINLAWGAKYAHIKRPQWILAFLDTLDDADVVLFADGGDTIYTGVQQHHIYERFEGQTAPRASDHRPDDVLHGKRLHPVLFNAEANCYHQQTFDGSWGVKKGKCLSAYKRYDPNVTSPYRYLNGGAWIARVWAAKKVFRAAVDVIRRDSRLWCDQSVLGGILLSGALKDLLGLDKQNRFFLPTYHLRASRDLCDDGDDVSEAAAPRLRMCHSRNIPAVVHFNGKSEGRFTSEIIHRTSWFRQKSNTDRLVLLAEAKASRTYLTLRKTVRSIGDVCPALGFPS